MSTGSRTPDDIRQAAVDDYRATRDPYHVVAARHGVSRAALHAWVNPDGVKPRKRKTWEPDEIALAEGHWTPNGRGIQVWQPCFFTSAQTCNINHQENRNAA